MLAEQTAAERERPFQSAVRKGRGHKYIRREATGNPKNPWRYVYRDKRGKEVSSDTAPKGKKTDQRQEDLFSAKKEALPSDPKQLSDRVNTLYDTVESTLNSILDLDDKAERRALLPKLKKLATDASAIAQHATKLGAGRDKPRLAVVRNDGSAIAEQISRQVTNLQSMGVFG